MFLSALSALFHLSSIYAALGASCACSSVTIPVHVDALVPKDPTDIFGGLKSNPSSLRRVNAIYDVYGVFCQPNTVSLNNAGSYVLQLLVHGFTYTSQYWSPPVEEFRNYSYAAFSCDQGLASLAIDWVGVGLSSRPSNASDVQYATSAAAVSQLARHLKSSSIIPGVRPFNKIIGIGHSAGSVLLNFDAIVEGPRSPFDGLILTAALIIRSAGGTIDPAYVTTNNRSLFYPPDSTSFSPRMFIFDEFTKDVGSLSTFVQVPTTSLTTHFTGPVAKVVGSEDQLFCTGTDRCDNVAALTAAERVVWPAARSFEVVVAQGSGHDLNLDFFAQGPFNTFIRFVDQFAGLS
ncbi:Alpha/beta-hydrolase [Mycena venus]|uniref:Alpha/beta-hydrolase n=1 Tax=Mycena venus TaxID=2733690 RepID=A0A8H6Z0M0_9AGAR|nr:Alpha/beta-hydrolase [Mycena venus]